jgi:hypothetical protein
LKTSHMLVTNMQRLREAVNDCLEMVIF